MAIRKSLRLEDSKDPRRDMQLWDNIEETVASLESLPRVLNAYNLFLVSLPLSNDKLWPSMT